MRCRLIFQVKYVTDVHILNFIRSCHIKYVSCQNPIFDARPQEIKKSSIQTVLLHIGEKQTWPFPSTFFIHLIDFLIYLMSTLFGIFIDHFLASKNKTIKLPDCPNVSVEVLTFDHLQKMPQKNLIKQKSAIF